MEIRINIASLTPEQAFNLGTIIRDLPNKSSSVATLLDPIEIKAPKTRSKNRKAVKRFSYNTSTDIQTIEYCVNRKKDGVSGLNIARELNEMNILTVTGKKWTDPTVWYIMYSRQARKFWNVND